MSKLSIIQLKQKLQNNELDLKLSFLHPKAFLRNSIPFLFYDFSIKAIFIGSLTLVLSSCQTTYKGIGAFTSEGFNQRNRITTEKGSGLQSSNKTYEDLNPAAFAPLFPLYPPVEDMNLSRGFIPHKVLVQQKQKRKNRRSRWSRRHLGLDMRGALNTPIHSAHDGRVVYAGNKLSGYGNVILIEYNESWATLYAHLNQLLVSTGDYIRRGQPIGLMGKTGRSTGVHLHFELMKNKTPIDPLTYIEKNRLFSKSEEQNQEGSSF